MTKAINRPNALIRNDSGDITLTINRDLMLNGNGVATGGADTFCYVEISSGIGNITDSRVERDIILNGGPTANAYAQIGRGEYSTETVVQSNITFSNVTRNVTLNAGTGDSSYVQIGQSPFNGTSNISAAGNITFNGITGSVNLNGGTNNNTTAIIGHGNELTNLVNNTSGDFSVNVVGAGNTTLTPGTGTLTHAIIGYHNPRVNPTGNLTGVSNQVQVVAGSGTIELMKGNQNNSIIGYYNAGTNQPVNLSIGSIMVTTSLTGAVTLDAGNDNGSLAGVASIGTLAPAPSTATSTINISTGTLNLYGPTGTDNGLARVINVRPQQVTTGGITINAKGINVLGGTSTAAPTGFSDIYSGLTLTLTASDNFDINNDIRTPPSALQTGKCYCYG